MAASPIWTIAINGAPEDVWPLVGDLDRHHEWSPKPYRVEWPSGEPNAVGSRFRSTGWLPQDKEHVMEGSVAVNEPGKVLEV
jgi:polyketide cyclase/dehydrase/lipid transport protein